MSERPCGPNCPTPDAPHREPEPDWIGDTPILHGESDHLVPGTGGWNGRFSECPDSYCLCGHPNHLTCPEPSSLLGMAIERGPEFPEVSP